MYLILLLALVILAVILLPPPAGSTLKYYKVIEYFEKGEVQEYSLDMGTGELTMLLKGESKAVVYKVPNIELFVKDVSTVVKEYNTSHPDNKIIFDYIPAQEMPWWMSLLPTLLLIGGMGLLWYFMYRQSQGGGKAMSFAKAKVKPSTPEGKRVTFADVAGAEEEKEDLVEIVEFLKNPKKFNELGARVPKGVLLVGPPGTGKTLLARAVAGEAGVPFFSISGSGFVEMFVGVGASRVRDLFEQAKKDAPSIIFIDEIDAVGRHRGAGLGGGHDEREQTLNQLLVEMDGFEVNSGIIVMAATNRKDILDPALLRPGRFDRLITVLYPDIKGREDILKVHSKNKPMGPDVDLSIIARSTPGFTGADLENLLNEAALLSARKGLKAITMAEIQEATIKVMAGPEKRSHKITDDEKQLTAYHEAGHAVATYYCKTQSPVHQISIIPRGGMGGYTMSLPEKENSFVRKSEMFESIVTLLGGRVAEQLKLDDISTGASNDLERATKTARAMVTKYGFSDKIGAVVYADENSEVFLGRDFGHSKNFSEHVAAEIDDEVKKIIDEAYSKTKNIISDNIEKLERVAKALIEFEKIEGDQFKKLMEFEAEPSLDPAE